MVELTEKSPVNIHHDFVSVRERQTVSYSEESLSFWNGNPPERIIISTGSVRKAIMAIQLMNGFVFTYHDGKSDGEGKEYTPTRIMQSPLELQTFYDSEIHNGDGHLPQGVKVLLGYFHDVPVYAENGNGEGKDNFPIKEAEKKALFLAQSYLGQDVIIVSTDTVNHPTDSELPLGKPMNDPDYPRASDFDDVSDYENAVAVFKKRYVETNYRKGKDFMHSNGIAVVRTNTTGEDPILISDETVLKAMIREQAIKIFEDCAGGGVLQQLIDWTEELSQQLAIDEFFSVVDAKFTGGIEHKDVYMSWVLMCQISGMPWWFISENISKIVANAPEFIDDEIILTNNTPVKVRRISTAQSKMVN